MSPALLQKGWPSKPSLNLPCGRYLEWARLFCWVAEKLVGATGFEPATSWSQTKCSSQAELRSDERVKTIPYPARNATRKMRLPKPIS